MRSTTGYRYILVDRLDKMRPILSTTSFALVCKLLTEHPTWRGIRLTNTNANGPTY